MPQDWLLSGVEHYWLPVPDFIYAPSVEEILPAIEFMRKFEGSGRSVYVHCKAGRTRSATVLGCYLMQVRLKFAVDMIFGLIKPDPFYWQKYGYDAQKTIDFMKEKRPQVVLRTAHLAALDQYEKCLKGQI